MTKIMQIVSPPDNLSEYIELHVLYHEKKYLYIDNNGIIYDKKLNIVKYKDINTGDIKSFC